MKKLLFLTPELPYPGHSGGKLKSLKLLEWLQDDFELTLACPLKLDDHLYVDEFMERYPGIERMYMGAIDVPRSPVNLLRSYLKRVPLNVLRTAHRGLARRVASVIDDFDVVFIDHYEVGQYVPRAFRGQRIYHAHNAYYKLWQRYAEQGENPAYRLAAAAETARVRRAEVALCNDSDLVFASPNDIDALAVAGAERDRLHQTFHLGDDCQLELPALRFDDTEERLLYVGNLAWEPNAVGLHWFIESVWPLLLEQRPGLKLDIVGRNPDSKLRLLADAQPGIELLGFVEDLETVYPRSRISIAPLTFGAGMKVKVLSALGRGIPVVTTSVGAEGIDARHGQQILIQDEAAPMAADILRLLRDQLLWQRLSEDGRQLVRDRYTWKSLLAQMRNTMDTELERTVLRRRLVNESRSRRQRAALVES